jgi:SH3-like domain-containing protein
MATKNGSGGAFLIGIAVIGGMLGLGKKDDPPRSTQPASSYQTSSSYQPAAYQPSALETSSATPSVVTPPPAPVEPKLRVTGNDIALRKGPGAKTAIVDRLSRGTVVVELDRNDGWVKVRHPVTAAEGWVKASLVRADDGNAAKDATAPEKTPTKIEATKALATSVVVSRILAESRAGYPGNCACPDDVDKRGHRCGGRSAYSRPGGYAPLCYPRDVTKEMIAEYRSTH